MTAPDTANCRSTAQTAQFLRGILVGVFGALLLAAVAIPIVPMNFVVSTIANFRSHQGTALLWLAFVVAYKTAQLAWRGSRPTFADDVVGGVLLGLTGIRCVVALAPLEWSLAAFYSSVEQYAFIVAAEALLVAFMALHLSINYKISCLRREIRARARPPSNT